MLVRDAPRSTASPAMTTALVDVGHEREVPGDGAVPPLVVRAEPRAVVLGSDGESLELDVTISNYAPRNDSPRSN